MLRLENETISVAMKPLGAELASLFHKKNQLEYLWQAGEAWPKHSPVLFPIVGQLRENTFYHNGKSYELPRHGFAREKNFSLIEHGPNRLVFRLMNDDSTFKIYPFHFIFEIEYALHDDSLMITYIIENPGKENLYFSVGGHPAFKVPLNPGENYEDYFLKFDKEITCDRWPLQDGLIADKSIPFMNNTSRIQLTRDLFKEDALIFKNLKAKEISIRSDKHAHGLTIEFNACPYLGIWAAKNGDFVCIEPWYGIADNVNSDQKLVNKKGIECIASGSQFSYCYAIQLF